MASKDSYPFLLNWIWGHQTKVPPINISTSKKKEVFYTAGPVGICYDWIKNKQHYLLAHKNDIVCTAVSPDKRYLVTADMGEENALIIWDAETREIFFLISDYIPLEGISSMCFSSDGSQLLTLIKSNPQELCIWNWKDKNVLPNFSYTYRSNAEYQHYVTFHSNFSTHFASCGNESVVFFERNEKNVKSAFLDVKSLYDEKVARHIGNFTQTTFSTVSSLAVSATSKGMIAFWGRPLYSREKPAQDSEEWLIMSPDQRVCIRIIQAIEDRSSISFLSSVNNFILVGTGRSDLLYYDEDFNVQWSWCFEVGCINNVSFSYQSKVGLKTVVKKLWGKKEESGDSPFETADFIIASINGYVGYYSVDRKELDQILWGTNHLIRSIALHPLWNYVYFGDYSGCLQKWDFTSKKLLNKEVYKSLNSEIELIAVDNTGAYAACAMSNGNLVIFNAACFSSKPYFIADEVLRKPSMMHFSPDSQHLLITDVSSYVTHYRLQLLLSKAYQKMQKDKISVEEPFWSYGGKSRQHQGQIVDSMFNDAKENETLFFYTLGEDRFLVQYNISTSKGLDIDVSKRIILERRPEPMCMTWYPLFDVSSLIAVLNDDGKMRIYCTKKEKVVRVVSLPIYQEPIKRIIFQKKSKHLLTEEFSHSTSVSEYFKYLIFSCSHMIGLSKFPIDGNPNTSLGMTSTPNGINSIVPNRDQTFLFTSGMNDNWIYMYEINVVAVLEAEREVGEGIEAFKFLFPSNSDPDEMIKKLLYSVYSLELELKMLKFGNSDIPVLSGEVPINFLQYVLAAIGCYITPNDLQLMYRDIEFENKYAYDQKKTTLSCLDIMKLYVNYRPAEPVTKNKLKESFKNILTLEEDPDRMTRARFIDMLTTQGDALSSDELLKILKCLKGLERAYEDEYVDYLYGEKSNFEDDSNTSHAETVVSGFESEVDELKEIIPEYITEDVFLQDIFCLDKTEENFSEYILNKDDDKRIQEYPKLEDFISALESNKN